MVSIHSGFEKSNHNNSLEKLTENLDFKAEDISWLIDNLPVTVFRSSSKLSWSMGYISTNVEKLTGYSKMDFINQKLLWSDIVFPEDITIIDKAVKKAKKNKNSYQIEYRIKKSDGSTAFIQEKAHLVCDGTGKLAYIAGMFLDLTSEAKRREDSHGLVKEDEKIQLEMLQSFVESLSRGEIPEPITDNYNGDLNKIKNNVNNCIEGLQGLVECNNVLHRLVMNDHTKSVEGKYVGIYASMGEATNSVRERLLSVNSLVNDIAVGKTSQLEKFKKIGRRSEQDQLLPAFIMALENINFLIEDTGMLSKAGVEGKLDTRADISKHHGEYRKIVQGFNDTLDAVIIPMNAAIEDSLMLSKAAVEGKLDIRADITRHEGNFRKIISGFNDTLDAVIGPLNVAAEYVERISRGDIPEPITDNYNGDFNEIKNNLNSCIEGLQGLVECNNVLQRMAVNDQTKGVEGEYVGIYASMGEATNLVRARVLNVTKQLNNIAVGDTSQLESLKKIGKRSEQDQLLPAIIRAMENVKLLIEDTEMLSRAAIEGKLDTRADVSRHQGEFKNIVEGINDTLDAVIGPLNEAIKISNEFSNGNFRARVDENLHVQGDFVNFRNVLNNIGISVSEIIKSAQSVTTQVAEHSDEASRGASEVSTAAENVAESSQKSSELTRELLYKIEGINREIIDLSASNEKIADSSKGILSAANEVVRIGRDAQALGRDTNLKMGSVEKIAKESVDGINSLTEQIKQIDSIVQLINDITSQINLLSLNAAIEAARAGEHGRGFAVVAGEVKNLATKARNATDTINTVVNSVQRDSKKTADAINTANNEIIDGVNSVNKTLDALNTIIKNATQVTKDIGEIAKAIDNQANISMKVVKASEEGNDMTQEVQREAEGLAAIAQETSASVQEIGAAIHEVTGLSSRLKLKMEAYIV